MIQEVLQERGNRYGSFYENAMLSQRLKETVRLSKNYHELTFTQAESIDMILHKIARAVNGDKTYQDTWVDIVGYAQLIVDELQETP